MRSLTRILRCLVTALPAVGAFAQQTGEAAPPISLPAWLNVPAGKEPTLESLRGRVVMLEFWGTWCGPCVRAMPEVQKMHDRYRDRGLTVLAISYEAPSVMRPFLEQNAYTMPVGSDPDRKVVTAYGIRGWPSTFLIDKEGKIAYVGSPYGVEAAIEKTLGLESSPATLLTTYLEAQKDGGNKERRREALARLMEKAPPDFDLRAWARAQQGNEQVKTPEDPGGGKPEAKEASHKVVAATVDGNELLKRCAAAWNGKDSGQQKDLLARLGDAGPTSFDLAAWVKDVYGKAFPIETKELQGLLQQQKFADVVEALVTRNPAPQVLALAARDARLADFCRKKAEDTRTSAKKAMMAQGWVFGSLRPTDNDRFWKEISVSGMSQSEDKKSITGVLIDGAAVTKSMAESYIQGHLAQAIVMEALGAGKSPRMQELDKLVDKDRQKILKPLEASYGPLPKAPH